MKTRRPAQKSMDIPEGAPATVQLLNRLFPVLDHLVSDLAGFGCLSGLTIGWHCHLTWLTALAVKCLVRLDAHPVLSECNPDTTQAEAVAEMRSAGASVHLGPDAVQDVVSAQPQLVSDTGLVLLSEYLRTDQGKRSLPWGACEITTAGISRLRQLNTVPLPVFNVNDGMLKTLIENFHGVGAGLVDALLQIFGTTWSGRAVAVVGYGRVGSGAACYLQRSGACVRVVEIDPVRRLAAHFDGFELTDLTSALQTADLLVSASGQAGLIGEAEWLVAADGLCLVNIGHWADELSPNLARSLATSSRKLSLHLEELTFAGSSGNRRIYLACNGSPVNVALLSGPIEPTLIHLTTEILTLNYLSHCRRQAIQLCPGELAVPSAIEAQAARLAFRALGSPSGERSV